MDIQLAAKRRIRRKNTQNDPQITQIPQINSRPSEIGSPKLHGAGKKLIRGKSSKKALPS